MLEVPTIDKASMVFGNIKHMPAYSTLPEEFRRERSPFCEAAQKWFFSGAEGAPNGIKIGDRTFTAKPGVDANKALVAIRAVLGSFAPKHEHKIAACGFMLSEWFDIDAPTSEQSAA